MNHTSDHFADVPQGMDENFPQAVVDCKTCMLKHFSFYTNLNASNKNFGLKIHLLFISPTD